jgi:hypothetical protein
MIRRSVYQSFWSERFPLYPHLCFAGSPVVPSSSGGGDSGGGAGSGGGGAAPAPGSAPASGAPGSNTSGTPGTPAPGGDPGAGAGGGDANIRQLRENYQKYTAYGKPEQIAKFKATYESAYNVVKELGTGLGYSEDKLLEAFERNPFGTRDFLLQKQAEQEAAGGGQEEPDEIAERIQAAVDRQFQPYRERENQRLTTEAQSRVDRVTSDSINAHFKALGVDPSKIDPAEREFMRVVAMEALKYNEKGLEDVKLRGKNAAVQEAFKVGMDHIERYVAARMKRERAASSIGNNTGGTGAPGRGAPPPRADGKKPTLDDYINDPGLVGDKYK